MSEAEHRRAFGFDRVAHMNAAKARKRGTGGKVYAKARKRTDYAPVNAGSFAHLVTVTRLAWQGVRSDAIEQFRFDVHGDQWEGF